MKRIVGLTLGCVFICLASLNVHTEEQQQVRVEKTEDGLTQLTRLQIPPAKGVFEHKTVDDDGKLLQWIQTYVDEEGKVVLEIVRKALGPENDNVPIHDGVQYINHHQYSPDGKLHSSLSFFGDGRLRQRVVYRYEEDGTVRGEVMRNGKRVGIITPPSGLIRRK